MPATATKQAYSREVASMATWISGNGSRATFLRGCDFPMPTLISRSLIANDMRFKHVTEMRDGKLKRMLRMDRFAEALELVRSTFGLP